MKRIQHWWMALGRPLRWRIMIVGILIIGTVIPTSIALAMEGDWAGLLLNLGSEMGGAVITFILLDQVLASRDREEEEEKRSETVRQQLIHKLGSQINHEARRAAEELRSLGWLTDGSLNEIELIGANLEGVDLRGARLRGARMYRANLRNAKLSDSDFSGAELTGADLSGASCVRMKVEGAFLAGAKLDGCKQLGRDRLSSCARLKGANMPDGKRYDGSFCLDGDLTQLEKYCRGKKLDGDDPSVIAEWYQIEMETYIHGQEWAQRHLTAIKSGDPRYSGEYVDAAVSK